MVIFMPRVVHFELIAEDIEKAIEFYSKAFDWKFIKWEGQTDYWLISTGKEDEPSIDGGLGRRDDPDEETTITIDVPDIEEAIKNVEANGGTIYNPKMTVPGVGWLAQFKDPEGHKWSMMQREQNAK